MKELLQENGWLGVAFILTLQFVYSIWKDKTASKDKSLNDNTFAVTALTASVDKLQTVVAAIPKLQTDMKRNFSALRIISGNDWPRIRDEILKDADL